MSKKKKYTVAVTKELHKIYKDAWEEGIWICEFGCAENGGYYTAAAGSVEKLEEIEKKLGREIDVSELRWGDYVNLFLTGTGKTHEGACRNAVAEFKKYEEGKSK